MKPDGEIPIWKPTAEQIRAVDGKFVPDIIMSDLKVLFCGINPGLYSAAVGHHFARPGNRFWPALHLGGFTDRLLSPFEEQELLKRRLGITNIVQRATAGADELTAEELRAGATQLAKKLKRYRPKHLAVLGVGAFRFTFEKKNAKLGLQEESIEQTRIWVLPNPSGLNANYLLQDLGSLFAELRMHVY